MFSPDWYRVAALRLRLRPRADLHRRDLRGRLWYVVRDHQSGRYYRLSPAAYLLVRLLDGRRTIREAWELVGRRYGPEQPSQDEIIVLLRNCTAPICFWANCRLTSARWRAGA